MKIFNLQVVNLVASEFIQQGDIEREKFHENNIPVSPCLVRFPCFVSTFSKIQKVRSVRL